MCAYGVFAVADGHVALGVTTEDPFWNSLSAALGMDDLVGVPFRERLARGEELRHRVIDAMAGARRDELVATLLAADVPIAPVHSHDEMAASEHLRARGTVVPTDAGLGLSFGPLLRMPGVRTGPPPPPPGLDEHRGAGFG